MSKLFIRYCPGRDFPPYAFIPGGKHPHPRKRADGHSYNVPEPRAVALDPNVWWDHAEYLFGVDLFNGGYPWEAHEVWEGLWIAAGKRGEIGSTASLEPVRSLLQGLIRLAAARIKQIQGVPRGVRKHTQGAARHFESLGRPQFCGLDIAALQSHKLGARLVLDRQLPG